MSTLVVDTSNALLLLCIQSASVQIQQYRLLLSSQNSFTPLRERQMQALLRLVIIATALISAVFTAPTKAKAETALLTERGTLASGDAILNDGSLYDQYTFPGYSGQRVIIYLESQDFDPYLILLDPNGRRISENDDISRQNRNSRLFITLQSTGTYTVVANSYEAGKNGVYLLKVNTDDDRAALVEAIAAANGQVERSSSSIMPMPSTDTAVHTGADTGADTGIDTAVHTEIDIATASTLGHSAPSDLALGSLNP
jgi:hypothetical protein